MIKRMAYNEKKAVKMLNTDSLLFLADNVKVSIDQMLGRNSRIEKNIAIDKQVPDKLKDLSSADLEKIKQIGKEIKSNLSSDSTNNSNIPSKKKISKGRQI